jgi:hypothetical protein
MPSFDLLDGTVTFDREVTLRNGGVESSDHPPATMDAPVTFETKEHALNTYVQLWSAPVNIRAHNLKITEIGDILEFGWVNIITASERRWFYGNGHVVRECVAHLPTWDTAGIGPWYQEVYWSTDRAVGDCEQVEEGEEVDQVFFNDRPWTPPYEDLYEHNGVPLGRLHYYSPQRLHDQLQHIRGQDKYIACLAFKDDKDNWAVPWHVCWQVDFSADVTTAIVQPLRVTVTQHSRTRVYTHEANQPHSLLLQVLNKDGSEGSKNYELLPLPPEFPYGGKEHGPIM